MKTELVEAVIAHSLELSKNIQPLFADRTHAGELLGKLLSERHFHDPVLVTIPLGGIEIATAIQKYLSLPFKLFFSSKIPLSSDDRFGIGALTEHSIQLNEELMEMFMLHSTDPLISNSIERTIAKLVSVITQLKPYQITPPEVTGKTLILIDDGLSSGQTLSAAAKELEKANPSHIVCAVPVASVSGYQHLERLGYECVTNHISSDHGYLVDNFYNSFPEVSVTSVHAMFQVLSIK